MNFTQSQLQILNELNQNDLKEILNIFEKFPVKNFQEERFKLIQNGKSRYLNGFVLDPNNEVDIYLTKN